ncbi:MAG TPA: hypothetical protein VI432_01890 [Candidatus Paceibacterota bacterium]
MAAGHQDYKEGQNATTIIRRVKVNRTLTPEQVIEATGRTQYVNPDVLATMPQGEGEEVEVHFFNLGRDLTQDELECEYERLGLVPDPRAQAQVNTEDPAFADDHPNATQWDVQDNVSSFVTFVRWSDKRIVGVDRGGKDWSSYGWFAGVHKSR